MAVQFLWGALTATSAFAGVFFLKFWSTSRDRFFLVFAIALFALASNWALLAWLQPHVEHQPFAYLLRLAAFSLICVGIAQKNGEP